MARSLPSAFCYRSTEKILMPPELQKQCAEERVLAQIIGASDAAPESGRNVRGKTE